MTTGRNITASNTRDGLPAVDPPIQTFTSLLESVRSSPGPLYDEVCLVTLSRGKSLVPYLVLAAVSAVYLYPFVRSFSEAPDAGVFLYGADLVSHGAMPSRDFVEMQGPGSFVWLALFFRLFGSTLETARVVLAATGVSIGLLTFGLSRRLGATGLFAAIFAVVISIPLLPVNSPHYDSSLFALIALTVFLPVWEQALRDEALAAWRLLVAASLCGVVTWMIQQKGLYLAAALLISLGCLMRKRLVRPCLIFSASYAVTVLLPFVYFACVRSLPDVWFANYVWPATTYSAVNAAPYGFPIWQNLEVIWRQQARSPLVWPLKVASAMPFLVVAGLPLLLPLAAKLSGRRWFQMPMLPYWLAAYALWLAELHRLDIGHLRNGTLLMAVLFFSLCEASASRLVRSAGLFIMVCLALSGTSHFLMSWGGEKRTTRRGEVYVQNVAAVLDFLDSKTYPRENVFVYPYAPIFYFVENVTNPTRYSYLLYGFNSETQFREARRDLERKQVRYVIVDSLLSGDGVASMFPAYRQPAPAKLIMEPYLETRYHLVRDFGRYRILERNAR